MYHISTSQHWIFKNFFMEIYRSQTDYNILSNNFLFDVDCGPHKLLQQKASVCLSGIICMACP